MASHTISLASPTETARLAGRLAGALRGGDVVALDGSLGAGKTTFVRSVAEAVGAGLADFGSPTFVIAREYLGGRIPLIHADAYRLADPDEFLAIGGEEFFDGPAAVLIEWADRVAEVLPADRLSLRFGVTGETARAVTATAGGPRSAELLAAITEPE